MLDDDGKEVVDDDDGRRGFMIGFRGASNLSGSKERSSWIYSIPYHLSVIVIEYSRGVGRARTLDSSSCNFAKDEMSCRSESQSIDWNC